MQSSRAKTSSPTSLNLPACGTARILNALEEAKALGHTKIAIYTRGDDQLIDAIRIISALRNIEGLDIRFIKGKKSFSNGDTIDGRYAIRYLPEQAIFSSRRRTGGEVVNFLQRRQRSERARRLALAA